jgi:hypothetical protein
LLWSRRMPNRGVHQPLRLGAPLPVHSLQCAVVSARRKWVFVRARVPRPTAGRADREGGHQQAWPQCPAAIPPGAFRLPVHRQREECDEPANGEQCEENTHRANEPGPPAGTRQSSMASASYPGAQTTDGEVDDQRKIRAEKVEKQVEANEA